MMIRKSSIAFIGMVLLGFATQAVHAQCSHDGPSRKETLNYIVTHSSNVALIKIIPENGKLLVKESEVEVAEIDFMNLSCERTEANTTADGGEYKAWLLCRQGIRCVLEGSETDDGGIRYKNHPERSDWGFETESSDQQLTGNLVRALQHLVFLLQEEFRNAHPQSDDPFARPASN